VQVGAGLWGRSWAELIAASRGFELSGVVDRSTRARAWARAELGVLASTTLAHALKRVECDVVLLVSPPATHRALAEEALELGAHVVIEKPLALELADARHIAERAERAGRLAVVAQNYRFRRQSRALRDLVQGGELGQLRGITIRCVRDLRNTSITPRDWRGKMRHPYLFDMAIHHVDLVRAITGLEVEEVTARSWRVPGGPFRHDASTAALLTLTGGVPVAYEGTWDGLRNATSWNGDWEIVGERGRATWDGGIDDALSGKVTLLRIAARPERVPLPRVSALDRLGVLRELQDAVTERREPECSVQDNLASLATVIAMAGSTEEGRAVRTAEHLNE
jgi:predicted dehydrogenase